MNALRRTWLKLSLLGLAVVAFGAVPIVVQAHVQRGHRQYYARWQYHPRHSYYYRKYYYKPYVAYPTHKIHYCVYYPTRPKYYYYYNPYRRTYWGRCEVERTEEKYSLLAEGDRKENLEEIPESAFPEPSTPPGIPESEDNETMLLSPNDLPEEARAAASGN